MCHRLIYSHLLFPLSVSCDHFLKKKEERERGGGREEEREREIRFYNVPVDSMAS